MVVVSFVNCTKSTLVWSVWPETYIFGVKIFKVWHYGKNALLAPAQMLNSFCDRLWLANPKLQKFSQINNSTCFRSSTVVVMTNTLNISKKPYWQNIYGSNFCSCSKHYVRFLWSWEEPSNSAFILHNQIYWIHVWPCVLRKSIMTTCPWGIFA